jgi:outer membrane protein
MPWTVPARTTALAAAGLTLASATLAQSPPTQPTQPNTQNPPAPANVRRQDSQTPTTQPGSNPPARRLTLQEAVAIALQNSKNLRLAAEGVNRARGRVSEQRTGFNPSLGATGTFTHLDEGATVTFPDASGNPQTIPIVRQNQKAVSLQGNVPLDIFGLIRTAVEQAQFNEIAARLDFNRTRNQTVLDVKNAYYDVLRAKAFVTVQEQALVNAQDRQKIAEANLRAGTGTRFDVLRAQTDVANAEQNVIAARNRVNLSIATLNNVLNIDQNTPVDVTEATEPSQTVEGFDQAVSEAYGKRPEIFQADANIRAAEKGVKLANRSSTPTLGVGANLQYTPDAGGFAPKTSSWAAVATVTLPIFDQGLSRARRQQAHADVETAKTNKQISQDTVALEVRQAYLAMQEAQDRLNVTSAALDQAREQYRLAQVRFQAGVTAVPGGSPLLEISDAQAALTQAQTNNVNAQYDLQNAKARLDRAIGRYAFDGAQGPGLPAPTIGGK